MKGNEVDVRQRLEDAALIVAAIARRWRETADHFEVGGAARTQIDGVISTAEKTARNLVTFAAAQTPEDWS